MKNYLRRKQEKGDLVVMDFPPQSRGLIPIENLWNQLKREKVKHDPTSTVKTTYSYGMSWIRRLIEYMPGRI